MKPIISPGQTGHGFELFDPQTKRYYRVSVVITRADYWPHSDQSTDSTYATSDLTLYAPLVVGLHVEGLLPEGYAPWPPAELPPVVESRD